MMASNTTEGAGVAGWVREHLAIVIGVAVLVVVVLVWSIFAGAGRGEPDASGPSGTAVAPGQVDSSPTATAGSPDVTATHSPDPTAEPATNAPVDPTSVPTDTPTASVPASVQADQDKALAELGLESWDDYDMSPDVQDPEPVAEAFGATWTDGSVGHKKWLAGLKEISTDFLYDGFTYTSEENLPSGTVTTINVKLYEPGDYEIPFRVFTQEDGPVMDGLMLLQPDGSWLVDGVYGPEELVWES